MANRLTSIITGGGDKGETSLAGGNRVPKDSERIEAIGCIDELNSFIGLLNAALEEQPTLLALFRSIQNDLFDLGGELAMPGHSFISDAHWQKLEQQAATLNADLPPLENFILPGGNEVVSRCHVVRSVTRRAERRLITLSHVEAVNPNSCIYLNRLSDLCFITARWLSKHSDEGEVLWQPAKVNPEQ
ncbi:MAG: cob(I)yrinic acid a,c-diamide adenosyltransferase [Pseudomonadales bacterium]|jgi:cob(I)alamin adenosyltransferase